MSDPSADEKRLAQLREWLEGYGDGDHAVFLLRLLDAARTRLEETKYIAECLRTRVNEEIPLRQTAEERASALAAALNECVTHLADWAEPGKCLLTVEGDLEVLKRAREALSSTTSKGGKNG